MPPEIAKMEAPDEPLVQDAPLEGLGAQTTTQPFPPVPSSSDYSSNLINHPTPSHPTILSLLILNSLQTFHTLTVSGGGIGGGDS